MKAIAGSSINSAILLASIVTVTGCLWGEILMTPDPLFAQPQDPGVSQNIPPLPGESSLLFSPQGIATPTLMEVERDKSSRFKEGSPTPEQIKESSRNLTASFLIPGWGQFLQGNEVKGYAFLGAEVVLILSVVGLRQYAAWLERDYRQYAHQHAGAPTDREHQYYVDIGNWRRTDDYNNQRLRDRQFERLYHDPELSWEWQSDAHRLKFKGMRLAADQARNRALLLTGAIILNHLASGIEATRNRPLSLTFAPQRGLLGVNLRF